ncbi:unnamed protein product [Brassica napus]|uniref:(rape) hypothetical protein n=1 Tax=Brassica napus TaxID=3708 RepID=A0A816IQG3_BRANA|nr:unnamed protein product [Brassica napus]
MKGEIVRWLTGLTSNMVGAVEKMVREAKKDSAEESKGDESDESKGEESKGEESRAEESKAAETAPKGMTTRAKARDTQATVSESENENGGISVVVVDKEQSRIDYGSVKKLKQQSHFDGNSTAKVIIPNQPKQGLGYNPFANPDRQKLSALLNWKVKGSSSHWFYVLLTPTKWLIDTHMDAGINPLRLRCTKHPEWFRSDRICMLDAVFTQMWTAKYSEFLVSPANPDGSERSLGREAYCTHAAVHAAYVIYRCGEGVIFDETRINGTEKRDYKHLGLYD